MLQFLLIVVMALGLSMPVGATTFYVDQSIGNDAFSGTTEGQPFATFGKCISALNVAAGTGHTCLIKNGTYLQSSTLVLTKSGAVGSPITIKAYPGHTPVLDWCDVPCVSPWNTDVTFFVIGLDSLLMQYIVIEGLEITHAHQGLKCSNYCSHLTLRGNYFHHNKIDGFFGTAPWSVLDGNIFANNGVTTGHGIYITGRGYTIINNLFFDMNVPGRYGAQLAAYEYNPGTCTYCDPSTDYAGFWESYIANNVFAYNAEAGVVLWQAGNGSGVLSPGASYGPMSGNIFENNIFFENGNGGINCLSCLSTTDAIARSNLFYATAPRSTSFLTGTTSEIIASGTITNNPLFVQAPAGQSDAPVSSDFHLQSISPALDAGNNLTAVLTTRFGVPSPVVDLDGVARPTGAAWEIGAYEFASIGDITPPAPPTNLRITQLLGGRDGT